MKYFTSHDWKNFFSKKLLIINLFIFQLISRASIYNDEVSKEYYNFGANYLKALKNENFLEFLFFFHSRPIINPILKKISLFFPENIYLFFLLLNSIYTLFFLFLLICIFENIFKRNNFFSLFFLYFISLLLIPYETWRPIHHDHILILLTSILIFMIIYFQNNNSFNKYPFFVLTFFLILLSSNMFLIFFSFTLLMFIFFKNFFNLNLKYILSSSFLVILVFVSLCTKNFYNTGNFSPSSTQGWNMIQRTLYSTGYDNYFDLVLKKNTLPPSNQLCIKDIENKKQFYKDQNKLFAAITLNKCFYDFDNGSYDYKKLKNYLIENNIKDNEILLIIDKDLQRLKKSPWIYSGGYEVINSRLSNYFHKVSEKIYFSALKYYPVEMILGSSRGLEDQGILYTSLKMFRWGGSLPSYYEPQLHYNNSFFKLLTDINSYFVLTGLFLSFIIFFKTVLFQFKKKISSNISVLISVLLPILLAVIFFTSLVSCCENQRMSVMYYPLFLTISILSYFETLRNLYKKIK